MCCYVDTCTCTIVIIINQSTITLFNFYYNYYYRRVFAYYYYYMYYIGSQAIYYYYTVSSNLYYYIWLLPHVEYRSILHAYIIIIITSYLSATWPAGVRRLAESYMKEPFQVTVGTLDLRVSIQFHTLIQTFL